MRLAIVHLSDIHFRSTGNPLLDVVQQLAQSISSVDAFISLFVVVISGDIAFSGKPAEYQVALRFLGELSDAIQKLQANARIEFVSVPGNHDCVLPETGVKLREALIQALIPSMQDKGQDPDLLKQVIKAQAPYNRFRNKLRKGSWNGLCEVIVIRHEDKTIQLNLYNTALLSQRHERQGELHIPVRVFDDQITLLAETSLSVAVFHHSYVWLESNTAMDFRAHVENTSDIALSGHQHYGHQFYKENSTGERVLYIEAPALQDEKYPKTSAFKVLTFDWETEQERVVEFRRSRDSYRPVAETDWRPLTSNHSVRANFRFSEVFDKTLNQHGIPLAHALKGHIGLRDIFVFPNLTIRAAGAKVRPESKEVLGDEILKYVKDARRVIFEAPGLGGKTALARVLVREMFRRGGGVPILMSGRQISSSEESKVLSECWRTFSFEYGAQMLGAFRGLPKSERVLIVDDWHQTTLNPDGRTEFLRVASQYFEKIFLFTNELFQIHELLDQSTGTTLDFEKATIGEFGHALRGRIIDKWVSLGREYTGDSRQINREIEEKERLIQDMIGKNTLPSLPFIVLSLLQADQLESKAEVAEAGSFGYLYEVLVTVALSQTKGPKAQLEKKYVLLATIAYRMFKLGAKQLSASRMREIAEEYSRTHFVKLDFDSIISDLEEARVLTKIDGNYYFAYPHLFYYFIARYYRENVDREGNLRSEIMEMVENVSSDEYCSILTFIVYFARHSEEIIDKVVGNADRIYSQTPPADLDSDVAFLNKLVLS